MSMTITVSSVSNEAPFANYGKALSALDQIIKGNVSLDPLSEGLIKCVNAAQLEI